MQGALPNDVGTGSYRGDFKDTPKKKKRKLKNFAAETIPRLFPASRVISR